ncbi:MAG: DUF4388 domain-containing protein, partial [Xenococcaceae cyanobacterium]
MAILILQLHLSSKFRAWSIEMQGTLQEIDIRSLLQFLELSRQTGELYIEAVSRQQLEQQRADTNESLTSSLSQSPTVKLPR